MSDAAPNGGYQKMPPGWDCKYDQTTGNCYYINYLTKAMQLEDPRGAGRNYKQLQNERCSTESIAMQEMSSPLPFHRARLASNLSRRSTIQETSFSHQSETQAVVTKIQNMFPTADENHIRLLLKRYMKNIFPKADEMLLLDILANADNNVQFASEKLITLGYVKRDMQQPHRPNNRPPQLGGDQQPGNDQAVKHIPLRPKEYTAVEKTDMETLLKEKYPKVAERIILMALESVNYAEDRATQILQIVQDEDELRNQKQSNGSTLDSSRDVIKDQLDAPVPTRQRQHSSLLDNSHNLESAEFQSLIERMATMGPNTQLPKGADENLLLADYVTWNGPNTTLTQKLTSQGADASLLSGERSYKPTGRNVELCKGAKKELAKGSIYAQGKGANIKCN